MGSVISFCHSTSWRIQFSRSSSRAVTDAAAGLVLPVRRNALLGDAVHLFGADLHLELMAALAHHRGVQRLIAVGAGHGDEVLDAPRHRPPQRVDQPEDRVARGHILR